MRRQQRLVNHIASIRDGVEGRALFYVMVLVAVQRGQLAIQCTNACCDLVCEVARLLDEFDHVGKLLVRGEARLAQFAYLPDLLHERSAVMEQAV